MEILTFLLTILNYKCALDVQPQPVSFTFPRMPNLPANMNNSPSKKSLFISLGEKWSEKRKKVASSYFTKNRNFSSAVEQLSRVGQSTGILSWQGQNRCRNDEKSMSKFVKANSLISFCFTPIWLWYISFQIFNKKLYIWFQ